MAPLRDADLPHVNKIFVDREEPKRIFEKAAMAIPSDGASLRVFYGVGGQGKTALCQELMDRTNPEIEPSYRFLRRALLDLHGRTKTDPDLLLVWIRNEFAKAGLFMPCFDLALALTWEGTRGEQPFPHLVNPWLGRVTKAAKGGVDEGSGGVAGWLGSDTATQLLGEAVGQIPAVGFLLRKIGHWAIDKSKRKWLENTRDELARLYRDGELRPAHELSRLLPWMLAQDLNHHLRRNPGDRFVLFVDEYERVFDQGGAGARWTENPFDRHMRDFVKETNGLLVVFFSRERLPWEADPDWRADLEGNQHLLGGLAEGDADAFLSAIPIADAALRAAIVQGSRETSAPDAPVYPLMLDLQVEHWRRLTAAGTVSPDRFRLSADTFEARFREVVERTLRDYDAALQATLERLAFARRFDETAFDHVVTAFGTGLPLDAFDRIVDLSFVTRSLDGFASIHGVMANAIRSMQTEQRREEATVSLFEHFASRAYVESHFELTEEKIRCLFEAAELHWRIGEREHTDWLHNATRPLFDGAFYTNYVSLWRDTLVKNEAEFGPEAHSTGICLNNLAAGLRSTGDFQAAKPLCERALAINIEIEGLEQPSTGIRLSNLAGLLRAQGDFQAAKPLYERALYSFEKAGPTERRSAGICLNNLACLLRDMGDYGGAKPLFERALAITEEVDGPDEFSVGTRLNNLAELLMAMGDYKAAKPLFVRALAIIETKKGLIHPSTGDCLHNFAGLLRAMSDYDAAKQHYERALAIFEKALGPEHPSYRGTLSSLARLLQDMGDYPAAKPLFERALAIVEKALGPEHPSTKVVRGNLESLP